MRKSVCLLAFVLCSTLLAPDAPAQLPLQLDEDLSPVWQVPISAPCERSSSLIGFEAVGSTLFFAGLATPDFDLDHSSEAFKRVNTFVGALNEFGQELWLEVDLDTTNVGIQFAVSEQVPALFLSGRGADGLPFVRRMDAAGGSTVWQVSQPIPSGSALFSMPDLAVSADGQTLALATSSAGYEGPNYIVRHRIAVFDGVLGALRWQFDMPQGFVTHDLEVASDGARVFLAARDAVQGAYYCFDGTSGAVIWSQFGASLQATRLASSPGGDRLVAAQITPASGNTSSQLEVRDASGNLLWTRQITGHIDDFAWHEASERIFLTAIDANYHPSVLALESVQGTTLWNQPLASTLTQFFYTVSRLSYAQAADQLQVCFDGVSSPQGTQLQVNGLHATTGAVLWSDVTAISGPDSFAFLSDVDVLDGSAGPQLVVGSPQFWPSQTRDLRFRSHNVWNGAELWSAELDLEFGLAEAVALEANFAGPPSAWEDLIYAFYETDSATTAVRAIQPADGQIRWAFDQAGSSYEPLAHSNGQRFLSSRAANRVLIARNLESGLGQTEILGIYADTGYVKFRRTNPLQGAWLDCELSADSASAFFAGVSGSGAIDASFKRASLLALETQSGTTRFEETWPSGSDQARACKLLADPAGGRIWLVASRGTAQQPVGRVALLARAAGTGAFVYDAQWNAADLGFDPAHSLQALDAALDPSGTILYVLASVSAQPNSIGTLLLLRIASLDGSLLDSRAVDLPGGSAPNSGQLIVDREGARLAVAGDMTTASAQQLAYAVGYSQSSLSPEWSKSFSSGSGVPAHIHAARTSLDGRSLMLGLTDPAARVVTLDFPTGVELWNAHSDQQTGPQLASLGALLDLGYETFAAFSGQAQTGQLHSWKPASLLAGPNEISLAQGGLQVFALDAPVDPTAPFYLVLGSASGTSPSLPLGPALLPLVVDAYFTFSLSLANRAPFANTFGALDEDGQARATLQIPAHAPPALAGSSLWHAFVQWNENGQVQFASNPVTLLLQP